MTRDIANHDNEGRNAGNPGRGHVPARSVHDGIAATERDTPTELSREAPAHDWRDEVRLPTPGAGAVVTPRGFDATEAHGYEEETGHGFVLPGERDAWAADIATLLKTHAAELPAAPRVLDIGAGTGKFTRLMRDVLRGRFGLEPELHGVDASADMLDVAQQLDTDAITYTRADARALPAGEQYDLITSCQVLDSFEKPEEVLRHWQESARPGAKVLTVLAFSRPDGWTNRTADELTRMPLARVTSVQPLVTACTRAGLRDIAAGFLPRVSPLHGGASAGMSGPIGSRYYAIGTAQ